MIYDLLENCVKIQKLTTIGEGVVLVLEALELLPVLNLGDGVVTDFFPAMSIPLNLLLRVASLLSNSLAYSEYFVVFATGGNPDVGLPLDEDVDDADDLMLPTPFRLGGKLWVGVDEVGVTGFEFENVGVLMGEGVC